MNNAATNSRVPRFYLFLNALIFLAAGVTMTVMVSRGGFSGVRLSLISGTFMLAAVAGGLAILLQLQQDREQAISRQLLDSNLRNRLLIILGIFFIIFWCLTWFPAEYTRGLFEYFIALYPLILCGLFASGSALVYLITKGADFPEKFWKTFWLEHRTILATALFALAGFALIALLTNALGILKGYEPYWYGAGVPILAWQVFATLIIAILGINLGGKIPRMRINPDLAMFLVIWLIAALIWAFKPVSEGFWVTGPRPPNFEYYPFSDLTTFDLGSQFALIGQGINNRVFYDRALYMSFLVYLHSVGGQNYQQLMAVQAAIFAVFPALLFLIGRKLHSRNAGIILATLTTLRGLNSLSAAAWIDTSTFKHMLTDFPTAIGLAIFILLILKWLDSPNVHWRVVLWAAGVIGLTSLLRPHVLLLLPLLMLMILWAYRLHWKQNLIVSGVTLLAFAACISPWIFLGSGTSSIIEFYNTRIQGVIRQRYPTSTPPPTQVPALPSGNLKLAAMSPPAQQDPPAVSLQIPFAAKHFLHNIVTSALIFPETPRFVPVKETVKGGENFWQTRWDGSMSRTAAGMVILNLVMVALGLGAAYQTRRWQGLLPLGIMLIYAAANSLARTSGGRYLVPYDWILVCYFGFGVAELVQMGKTILKQEPTRANIDTLSSPANVQTFKPSSANKKVFAPVQALGVLALLAVIGGLIPLAGVLYPVQYPERTKSSLVTELEPYLPNLQINRAQVETFLKQPDAVLLYGRALYPRFYRRGAGEPISYGAFHVAGYPRTVYALIGPHGSVYVILPMETASPFPNSSDVIMLGCKQTGKGSGAVSALLTVLTTERKSYMRAPMAPLNCPIPAPVCDNNGNCQ
jgi:hypothetical protein